MNPTIDSLECKCKCKDILKYQRIISFIIDIKEKKNNEDLLNKIKESIEKDDINKKFGIFIYRDFLEYHLFLIIKVKIIYFKEMLIY